MIITKVLSKNTSEADAMMTYLQLEKMMNGNSHAGLFYLFGGIFMSIWIICLINLIATAIGRYKLFKKAGEGGFKAFIPGYSTYTMYKIAWDERCFFSLLCLIGISILMRLLGGPFFNLIGMLASFGIMMMFAILCSKLAVSYGKGVEYALGLFFLHPVFVLLLGFSDAKYLGPEGTKITDIFEELG